jgi:hypothetical protein
MNSGTTESSRKTIFPFAFTLVAFLAIAGWAQAQGNAPDDIDDEIGVLIGDLKAANPELRLEACSKLVAEAKYRGKAKRAIPALLKILEAGEFIPGHYRNNFGGGVDFPQDGGLMLSWNAIIVLKTNDFDAKTAVRPLTQALRKALSQLGIGNLSYREPAFQGGREGRLPALDKSPTCMWANALVVELSTLLGSAGPEAEAAVPVLLNAARSQVPLPAEGEGIVVPQLPRIAVDDEQRAATEAQAAVKPRMDALVSTPARKAAIEALGVIGSEEALEPLIRVRTYELEPRIKEAASRAIAVIRKARSERPKTQAPTTEGADTVKSTEAPGAKPGAEGGRKPSQPVIKAHLRDLGNADPQVRREAAEALGGLGVLGRSATPGLRKALRDKDETVREAAAKAIERIFAADYNQ